MFDILFIAVLVMIVFRIIQWVIKKTTNKKSAFLLQVEGIFIISTLSMFIYFVLK